MTGILRIVKVLTVLSALIAAGLALWRRKDTVKRTWDSLGGAQGIAGSANQMLKSAGPVKDWLGQLARIR